MPRHPTPQTLLDLLCAAGHRDTPYAAHYPAAAAVAHFAVWDANVPITAVEPLRLFQEQLLHDIEGLGIVGIDDDCPHDHLPDLLDLLTERFTRLRRSGHTQVLGTIALELVTLHDAQLTCQGLEGLRALFDTCEHERPEPRYRHHPRDYWTLPVTAPQDPSDLAPDVAQLFEDPQDDTDIDGTTYFFLGEKLHCLTHLASLLRLQWLRQPDLAERAAGPLALQIQLSAHHDDTAPTLRRAWGPTRPLWDNLTRPAHKPLAVPHRIKRLFALHTLLHHHRTQPVFQPMEDSLIAAIVAG